MKTINYHIKGIQVTFEELFKGRYLLFFIPGLVITLLYFYYSSYINDAESSAYFSSTNFFAKLLDYVLNFFVWMFFGAVHFITDQLYMFIVLTAISPFNTYLGEKLDNSLTGNKFDSSFIRFINDIIRMIAIVFIALALEMVFVIAFWILSFLPFIGMIDDIVFFIIKAFFFGFAFYDFALERYRMNIGKSLKYAFKHPLTMILTGSIFLLIYNIPYLGIPLSPVLTVMISTVVFLYLEKKLPKQTAELKTTEE